ncbi:AAA family ATPase [Belnapia sp. T18]|uniref:AAA family ATPase n=1 Tax=Belnapia arida TaxID=2804533 RepID=A0ABS1U8T6_9PROT|nr:AAA family ATPase [Belnapia arida]MBL6081098.1 AAA family ATPase [Belnapia arida]
MAIAQLRTPTFGSEGLLLIENREMGVPELQLPGGGSTGIVRVRTEMDILRSRALVEQTVTQIGLAAVAGPDFAGSRRSQTIDWLADALQKLRAFASALWPEDAAPPRNALEETTLAVQRKLDVRAAENSNIVQIRFAHGSAEKAAAFVNGLMHNYIAQDFEAKRNATVQANAWLNERLGVLGAEVEALEQRMQEERLRRGLIEVTAGSIASLTVGELQTRLATAREEFERVQAALENGVLQEAIRAPLVQALRIREAEVLQRLGSLGQRLGPRHPDLRAGEVELRDLRQQIGLEIEKLAAGQRREVAVAGSRVEEAEHALEGARATAQRTATGNEVLARLRREADAKRGLYEVFLRRAEQTRLASAQFPGARVVSDAVASVRPGNTPVAVLGILGGVAGLLLASAVAVLRKATRSRIESSRDLLDVTGSTNLGSLPALSGSLPALVLQDSQSAVAETLRALRMQLQSVVPPGLAATVLVTSPTIGDGKTSIAAALARLAALDGQKVLLLETDMRRPRLAAWLKPAQRGRGLEAVIEGRGGLQDSVWVDAGSGLHYLPSDQSVAQAHRLLDTPGFRAMLEEAQSRYQLVVMDSPPVMRVADAALLAPQADVTLLVVAWERTSRAELAEVLRRLPEGTRIATVLTRVRPNHLDDCGYYQGYAQTNPVLPLTRGVLAR